MTAPQTGRAGAQRRGSLKRGNGASGNGSGQDDNDPFAGKEFYRTFFIYA